MKPTEAQEELIGQILRRFVKYKDTYDEAYDHILSSLEELPDDFNFGQAIHSIIENDLGGANGLKALERQRIWFAIREFIKEYANNLLKSLTSVIVLPLAVCTYWFYYAIGSGWMDQQGARSIIDRLPMTVFGIALLLYLFRKRYLKQDLWPRIIPFRQTMLGFTGVLFLQIPDLLLRKIYAIYLLRDISDMILAILFLITATHVIAVFKLFANKKNFQTT
ncbi:MAG TPA: hypothetical protein VNW51_05445 [Mucilaginibacter sp.]|jgi:hypothetical protein|nr:hypothetical protein [Mucilaginibacter sp.]